MALRFPGEVEVDRYAADEGEGTGFDNLDPSAYAERVFTASVSLDDVLLWYRQQLLSLGWQETLAEPEVRQFTRDADEFLQVQVLPLQETGCWSWSRYYTRSGPFARISFKVSGSWPDTRMSSA